MIDRLRRLVSASAERIPPRFSAACSPWTIAVSASAWLLWSGSRCAGQEAEWQREFLGALTAIEEKADQTAFGEASEHGARASLWLRDQTSRSCIAAFELGMHWQGDTLENAWWRHPNRVVRVCVVALHLAMLNPRVTGYPNFEEWARKLDEAEERARIEEIRWVTDNLDTIAPRIRQALSKPEGD